MPAVTRIGDADQVHCSPPFRAQSVQTVFCNEKLISCLTHLNTPHLGPNCLLHVAPIVRASPTVFAEGLPVGRIGDPIGGCTQVAEGSPDVFADGL